MDAPNNSAISGKLVHIGAEVLVLVSVVFYLNGQLKSMKNEIRELKAKLEDQDDRTTKHLTKLYGLVDSLQSRPSFPHHLLGANAFPISSGSPDENWHHGHPNRHPVARPVPMPVQMGLRQRHPKHTNSGSDKPSKVKIRPVPQAEDRKQEEKAEENDEPELPDEDELDEELKNELAEMEAMESLEESEEDNENTKSGNSKPSKAIEPPAQDLSFVQSAIRPTARKHQPIVKKSP